MSAPGTAQSLKSALSSWRVGSVSLLALSSGLPLGLVLTAVPTWMATRGVDIKTIGVLTLAQAPYAFKFLWSPVMDRYALPLLGRKRGWILLFQLALAVLTFALASLAVAPQIAAVAALTLLIAFASASQDIAIDAYAVETLRPDEHGPAVGARTAMYRVGMWTSGNIAITLSELVGWQGTFWLLAGIYLALVPVTFLAPEPEAPPPAPESLLKAVWEPFVSFLRQSRALELAGFLLLYKLADNLASALVRPFLVQQGYDAYQVGIASGTVGMIGVIAGTFLGGVLTTRLGMARALWLFGFLQAISNVGYALVANAAPNAALMYAAMAVETGTTGMGNGAFGVLLLRLTEKRFSATQFALFSSVFAFGRTVAGPAAGALADALGWTEFFLLTIPCAIPGLYMLHRFAPFGSRELPSPTVLEPAAQKRPLATSTLALLGLLSALVATFVVLFSSAALSSLKALRTGAGIDLLGLLLTSLRPTSTAEALGLVGAAAFGAIVGLGVSAYLAARQLPMRPPSP